MAILDFPATPSDGQLYTGPDTGVIYEYVASVGGWVIQAGGGGGGGSIPSGTVMSFLQASAPTGFTQVTTAAFDDASIRLVTGAGGGTGGSIAFSTLFSPTATYSGGINITSGSVGAASLTVAQLASHTHTIQNIVSAGTIQSGAADPRFSNGYPVVTTDPQGGNQTHTHSLVGATATGNFTSNFSVKYVNMIICSKD